MNMHSAGRQAWWLQLVRPTSLFVGFVFAACGWLLLQLDLLRAPGQVRGEVVEIVPTGQKSWVSQGREVWFYGAFDIATGARLDAGAVSVPSGWSRQGDAYVAAERSAGPIRIRHAGAVSISFGAHPYSGKVSIRFGSLEGVRDLHAAGLGSTRVHVPDGPSLRWSGWRWPLLGLLALAGLALGAACARRDISTAACLVMLATAGVVFLCAFYPGIYTNDTVTQLGEALSGQYKDWHPPTMAWTWRLLLAWTGRTESLFLFHGALLFGGGVCWLFVLRQAGAPHAGVLIPLLLLSPVVTSFSGVVWKDVGFAASLFLCSALVALSRQAGAWRWAALAVALAAAGYALGVRPTGATALIPIVAVAFAWAQPARPRWMTAAAGLVVTGLLSVAMAAVNTRLLDPERLNPAQYLQVFDLIGISEHAGRQMLPPRVLARIGEREAELAARYWKAVGEQGNANEIFFADAAGRALVSVDPTEDYAREVTAAWLRAMAQEPMAYLQHRSLVFGFLMGRGSYPTELPQSSAARDALLREHGLDPVQLALPEAPPGASGARSLMEDWRPSDSWISIGWAWAALAAASLAAAAFTMRQPLLRASASMLASSALLFIAPYVLVAPASDLRYLYWAVVATALAAVLVCVGWVLQVEAGVRRLRAARSAL